MHLRAAIRSCALAAMASAIVACLGDYSVVNTDASTGAGGAGGLGNVGSTSSTAVGAGSPSGTGASSTTTSQGVGPGPCELDGAQLDQCILQ